MAFTQLNLNGNTRSSRASEVSSSDRICRPRTTIFCGLLAATAFVTVMVLATNGCSRTSKPQSTASNQSLATPTPATQVMPPATPVTSPAPTPAPKKPRAHRKVVRKAAETLAYSDPQYAVSFRYPKTYILKTDAETHMDVAGLGPVTTNFVQPGGATLATIELPRDAYPGADMSSAFFAVSVNSNVTPGECIQFARPEPGAEGEEGVVAQDRKVGGFEYKLIDESTGTSDIRYYHVFRNGACYEFGLGLGVQPHEGASPVNSDDVFWKLEKILATVKIEPGVVPQVASAPGLVDQQPNR